MRAICTQTDGIEKLNSVFEEISEIQAQTRLVQEQIQLKKENLFAESLEAEAETKRVFSLKI